MLFRQLFDYETYTFTYILADEQTREAVIIDSVKENKDRDLKLIEELGLKLVYILDTHVHADHITGASDLAEASGAKKIAPVNAQIACADIYIRDGDLVKFGKQELKAISTPGHTDSCTSFYIGNNLFTGDTLSIRAAGRTDFQNGDSVKLFESIQKLYQLPDETIVYPGHDYKGMNQSTIGEEKKFNIRIKSETTQEEFIKTMSELKLANPKKIHEAVPANLNCGQKEAVNAN